MDKAICKGNAEEIKGKVKVKTVKESNCMNA